VIEMGEFNKAGQVLKFGRLFRKVPEDIFAVKSFYNGCKNLIEMPK
jgi:hypothetical protein